MPVVGYHLPGALLDVLSSDIPLYLYSIWTVDEFHSLLAKAVEGDTLLVLGWKAPGSQYLNVLCGSAAYVVLGEDLVLALSKGKLVNAFL